MAYAALTSLVQTLEKTPQLQQQIQLLKEKVRYLLGILEDSSPRNSLTINNLEGRIREAAYDAEDVVESHMHQRRVLSESIESISSDPRSCFRKIISALNLCKLSVSEESTDQNIDSTDQNIDFEFQGGLEKITFEFDSILKSLSKINDDWKEQEDLQRRTFSSGAGSSRSVIATDHKSTDPVGLDEDLLQIKHWLTGRTSGLDIISVTGMGGIGKTTLARNLYNDLLIQDRFDTRAWTVASQEYNVKEMLMSLLGSTRHYGGDQLREKSVEELGELLYKSLKGRRYLIVMDDVWETKVWDHVRRCFPDDDNGSRIILTTRLLEVAIYVNSSSSVHHMGLLSSKASWNLLRKKVFGEESYPSLLEEIGKKIANSCKGLPLAIVVISGLLSKGSRTLKYWEYVAENVMSAITGNDDRFMVMEILSLSYTYLPHHLKACFLYMGVFPEDYVIPVSRLIKLWVAEGFIKPLTSKSLEEVAEDYLEELVDRNLILVHKRNHNGRIKTVIIHDLLRELCVKKAQDEKFLQIINSDVLILPKGKKYQRRVSIHSPVFYGHTEGHDSYGRSLLFFSGRRFSRYPTEFSSFFVSFTMLRVLEAFTITFEEFPIEIGELVHLRYLAFTYIGQHCNFPPSIFKLRNLQSLIVYGIPHRFFYLPSEIWEIPQIRHISFDLCVVRRRFIEQCISEDSTVLHNLQTLSPVRNFKCTRKAFELMPNLKELGLLYPERQYTNTQWSSIEFNNFVYLHQLETLQLRFDESPPSSINFAFPPSLKSLTLIGCCIPWWKMTVLGSLPNLEVLKLKNWEESGIWEPNEGEFSKLKFLHMECSRLHHWKANDTHFPHLQRLSLHKCFCLVEISSEIGEIPTLEMIELFACSSSAEASAKLIKKEQEELGNDKLRVSVSSPHII